MEMNSGKSNRSKKLSGNQNASRGNETRLVVECTHREKAAWVKAAPGKLSDWVRENLNSAAE